MSNDSPGKVAIVSTSTSTIDFIPSHAELPITILRFRINIGKDKYLDGVTMRADTLMQRLYETPSLKPTTEPPPDEEILATFERLKKEGHRDILVLTVSTCVSKSYEICKRLAPQVEDVNIVVHDTEAFGMPEGLIVLKAGQMAKQGATIDEILKVANRMKYDIEEYGCVNNMNYLYGHDYVGLTQLWAAKFMKIKPIILFKQNEFKLLDKVRHFDHALERLAELTKEKLKNPNLQPIGLMLGNAEAYSKFIQMLPEPPKLEFPLSPVCASHLGVDGVCIAFCGKMEKYG